MNKVKVHGVVKRRTFFNEDTGFFVAVIEVPGRGECTVKGVAPSLNLGEHMVAEGAWEKTLWGPQFKAAAVSLSAPKQLGEIEKFLASAIEGIGPGFAKKLVEAFGEDIFNVIETSPERLKEIKGVGKKRLDAVVVAYNENRALRDIMLFLHRSGLGPGRAKRVYDQLGANAVKIIKANPYILCRDVGGIGFSTADDVAQKNGIAKDAPFRIQAGVRHVFTVVESSGSCGVPLESKRDAQGNVLVRRNGAIKEPGILDMATTLLSVDVALVREALQTEIKAGEVFEGVDGDGVACLFSKNIYRAEQEIADYFAKARLRTPVRPVTGIDEAILDVELDIGLILEETQRSALRVALGNQVCIITGGPGCGKTTITKVLLKVLGLQGFKTVLAAPTGKASKRAQEATGHEAKTVHRTYDYGKEGKYGVNENNPLKTDVLVIDESSMLDVYLMRTVLRGLSPDTRLIIIGDVDQLPSVGPGKVLSDLIAAQAVPTVRLTEVFRQAANSAIKRNAHKVNRGELPDLSYTQGSDFAFFNFQPENRDDEDEKRRVRENLKNELLRINKNMYKRGFCPIREVQVYAPMRKGPLGIDELNIALQSTLNPTPGATLEMGGTRWCLGDKVMQLRNNQQKQVFNGDVGFITHIDKDARTLSVEFDDSTVGYKQGDIEELTLAYAGTIHKAQGSESPVVIIPWDYSHFMMLKRNLLYTGLTRAKKLCVLLGDRDAVRLAVENNQNDGRHTRLKALLTTQA